MTKPIKIPKKILAAVPDQAEEIGELVALTKVALASAQKAAEDAQAAITAATVAQAAAVTNVARLTVELRDLQERQALILAVPPDKRDARRELAALERMVEAYKAKHL